MSLRKTRFLIFMLPILVGLLLAPAAVHAQISFNGIVVFGTSLSDPGNAYALTGQESTPPYETLDPSRIPVDPYADGGHHFSNGATWIEQFARSYGLASNAKPAYAPSNGPAFNYAIGGSRARNVENSPTLSKQIAGYLQAVNGGASPDSLYVIEIGGNDIRDALMAGDQAGAVITEALQSVGYSMGVLYQAGARKFLVCNVPDMGKIPAVQAAGPLAIGGATALAAGYNQGLEYVLGQMAQLPGVEIVRLDLFGILDKLVSDPAAFGLSVVDAACVQPGIAPYQCQQPDEYLFWDGIHPTTTVHGILARDAALAVSK